MGERIGIGSIGFLVGVLFVVLIAPWLQPDLHEAISGKNQAIEQLDSARKVRLLNESTIRQQGELIRAYRELVDTRCGSTPPEDQQ